MRLKIAHDKKPVNTTSIGLVYLLTAQAIKCSIPIVISLFLFLSLVTDVDFKIQSGSLQGYQAYYGRCNNNKRICLE